MSEASEFRAEVAGWLADNCPAGARGPGQIANGSTKITLEPDVALWLERMAERGWTAPTWPVEYGGGGLNPDRAKILFEEMGKIKARSPLMGMGTSMIGPTLLEYGTEEQKQRHIPKIARGEYQWCQGYSEPNAGSDLAALKTRAVDNGDHFVINGQKIWTSGADISQWCGALVRTDPDAKKRDGISFVMLPMDQPGVETKPIQLISGASPFCETFFTDARAEKTDLLGDLNDGWSVVKRLLQHERQSQTSARSAPGKTKSLQDLAKEYVGTNADGSLADADLRVRLANHLMDAKAHSLTAGRIVAEARGQVKVSAAASILKNSATKVAQTKAELTMELMGSQGVGWEGSEFTEKELANVREWLWGKAISIYGGSYEVQKNIISKNILGLPETTQKG